MTGPNTLQRIESGLVAGAAWLALWIAYPDRWWLPLALFLLFDLSCLGYLGSPRLGAAIYNLVHTYAWPALLAAVAAVAATRSDDLTEWAAILAASWAVHVGFDRMLGYGLKLGDSFGHTHLGPIGRDRAGQRLAE